MCGYLTEEIAPTVDAWRVAIHPDDWSRVEQALDDHFSGRTAEYESEHRVCTKTGSWIWVVGRGRVYSRDEQGRPKRMAGTALDVTARKVAEEALRLSEAKFSGIVSISADAVISVDDDQLITLFNAGAERIFGWSKAEAIGSPLEMLLPERFRATHRAHIAQFLAGSDVSARMGQRTIELLGPPA
jgi:PAS domain S-box-containing protein